MKYILLPLFNVALLVVGQTLFRVGAGGHSITSVGDIIKLLFSPVILIALVLYALTTILWLYILSIMPLSRAYPIQALAFPAVLIISKYILHEEVSMIRWIGVVVIFIGVVLVAQS
jgi:drug/metabolite transporter (DMT)-like permease